MSENTEQELATNGEPQKTEINYAEEVERLKSTNERLLFESQKNRTKREEYETLKNELEAFKKAKLEQEGNLQELLEMERKKANEVSLRFEEQNKKILKSNVYNTVLKNAPDAWDVMDLLNQPQASMIEVDEETLEPIPETVLNFVNSVRESKSNLFKPKKMASMADSRPTIDRPVEKNIKQMSKLERQNAMKDAISQAFKPKG